jgi:hypothetical protein
LGVCLSDAQKTLIVVIYQSLYVVLYAEDLVLMDYEELMYLSRRLWWWRTC